MSISSDRPDTAPGEHPAVATACGKVILLGEHAVVYGEPAIALPLPPLRLSVVLSDPRGQGWVRAVEPEEIAQQEVGDGTATMRILPAVGSTLDEDGSRPLTIDLEAGAPPDASAAVSRALAAAARSLGLPVPLPLRIAVRTGGLRSGMGTSAALGVAMARALLAWHGAPRSVARELAAAEAVETLFHGTPSGVDHTVSAWEIPLWFQKGEAPEPLRDLPPLHLVLRPRQSVLPTGVIVAAVRAAIVEQPLLARVIAELGRASRLGRDAWARGDLAGLAECLRSAQDGLERLGVVDDADRDGVRLAEGAGALAAKVTGAGRGGTLLALCAHAADADAVALAWGPEALPFVAG